MSLLARIKRLLGLGGSAEWERDEPAAVTVERERDPEPAAVEPTPAVEEPEDITEPDPSAPEEDGPAADPVSSLDGIGPTYSDRLGDAGVETVGELAAADPQELSSSTDIAESRLVRWVEAAQQRTSG